MNLPALVVAFLLPAHIVPFAPGDSASTGRDSAFVRPDSILRIVPLPRAGSLLRVPGSTASTITDSAKNFLDYRTPADLAGGEAGAYLRDFGSPGRLPDLTFGGLGGRNIAWLRDGVLLNDPLSGLFDPNLLPAEEAGRIEIFSGTSSFLYGLNAAGAAINV